MITSMMMKNVNKKNLFLIFLKIYGIINYKEK